MRWKKRTYSHKLSSDLHTHMWPTYIPSINVIKNYVERETCHVMDFFPLKSHNNQFSPCSLSSSDRKKSFSPNFLWVEVCKWGKYIVGSPGLGTRQNFRLTPYSLLHGQRQEYSWEVRGWRDSQSEKCLLTKHRDQVWYREPMWKGQMCWYAHITPALIGKTETDGTLSGI